MLIMEYVNNSSLCFSLICGFFPALNARNVMAAWDLAAVGFAEVTGLLDGEFENFKEKVRAAADIVEVVSSYVTLKKKGNNHWACCPFHGEKTPSFSVNAAKQIFYCYGCHEGGDVFRFIMKEEKCGFMDALKLLAARYGIPVPEKQKTPEEIKKEQQRKLIYNANSDAATFFHVCLTKTDYGREALSYLTKRGITTETIERFNIGYALNSWEGLVSNLGRKGHTPAVLAAAGLAIARDNGRYVARFRNRVMIPIKDAQGKVVGFGGRALDDSLPKYLNTAETEWFTKRRLLFGLDIASKAIRASRQAVVVEGYMDAISLHAAGVATAVASMGTAFSEQQAKMLKRHCEDVVLCYDSDEAGRRASVRAVSLGLKAGLKMKVAGVPEGKDPDEYVRMHGREAFLQVLEAAQDGIDFQIDETLRQNNVRTLAGKVEAVSNILPFLLGCKNEIEAAGRIRRLAQALTIDEGLIAAEYRKAGGRVRNYAPRIENPGAAPGAEEMFLAILAATPMLYQPYADRLDKEVFSDARLKEIFVCFADKYRLWDGRANFTEGDFSSDLSATAQAAWFRLQNIKLPTDDALGSVKARMLSDCFSKLSRQWLEREYEKHRALAIEYEQAADPRFKEELLESQRINDEIKKLYGSR